MLNLFGERQDNKTAMSTDLTVGSVVEVTQKRRNVFRNFIRLLSSFLYQNFIRLLESLSPYWQYNTLLKKLLWSTVLIVDFKANIGDEIKKYVYEPNGIW